MLYLAEATIGGSVATWFSPHGMQQTEKILACLPLVFRSNPICGSNFLSISGVWSLDP
jgi:hypothetical protein